MLGPPYTLSSLHADAVHEYRPFGSMLYEYISHQDRYLTTQHERDQESGYDYRGARFYDSEIGRFLSLDPKAIKYPALSAYVYTANNPIKFIDPDGKDVCGTDGNNASYNRTPTGEIQWTPNTSADFKTLGNEMLRTEVGTKILDGMINAPYPTTILIDHSPGNKYKDLVTRQIVDNPNENTVKVYGNTQVLPTDDGKGTASATVTVYEGSFTELSKITVQNGVVENIQRKIGPEKMDGTKYTKTEWMGATAVHEGTHDLYPEAQVPDYIQHEQLPTKNELEHLKGIEHKVSPMFKRK